MADTAGIAAIAAGSTLLASSISGTLSYLAAKRSTSAQLAAIEGEMDRLRVTHEEEERRERKQLYVDFLSIVNRNTATLSGSGPLDEEIYETQAEEFTRIYAEMLLFAAEPVIDELKAISTGFHSAGQALTQTPGDPTSFADRARSAFAPNEVPIVHAEGRLIAAMKLELKGQRLIDEANERVSTVQKRPPRPGQASSGAAVSGIF